MTRSTATPKLPWYAGPRAFARALLQLDDTPHSIALGAAIGMWIAITPTASIQMLSVLGLSFLTAPFFRFNRTAGVIMCYVTNPLTMFPIHYGCYKVGTLFVDGDMSYERLKEILTGSSGQTFVQGATTIFVDIGWPLLVGTLIVSTVSAVLTYPAVRWLVERYRGKERSQPAPAARPEPVEAGASR